MLPTTVIPIAERSGLINEIGRWVLTQACLDHHSTSGRPPIDNLALSVNVSAHQLMHPGFPAVVAGVLSATGTDPELVILEVTETLRRSRFGGEDGAVRCIRCRHLEPSSPLSASSS